MGKQTAAIAVAVLAPVLLFLPAASAQEQAQTEHYTAVWMVVGGSAGGSSVSFDIRVNKYNTEEEIKKYADLLVEGGPDRLRGALEKEDVGQVSPVGRVGTPIAIARKLLDGNKTIIRVVTARYLSFVELRYSGRSVDYPYTILQLELDQNGKGTGTAIGAAKIRFNKKKGAYEIESLQHGTAFNKLVNIRRVN